jgi:hypothetical protein
MIPSRTPCSLPRAQRHSELGTHWRHLLPHPLPPSPIVMSRTIPPSPPLLSARARLHHIPRLFSITDRITCSRHRRCQPQPRSHPRLHRNDTPIICTRWHRQSHSVRRVGLGYYSLTRPERAQACRRYLSTLLAAWPCAGSGKRKRKRFT